MLIIIITVGVFVIAGALVEIAKAIKDLKK
jgi:hypothetical protein